MEDIKNKIKKSILLVEDEEIVRVPLSKLLSRWIEKIYIAENGEEGLKIFMENDIDLIVTDLKMPIMDGIELTKKIREIRSDAKIIMTSGYYEADYLKFAETVGIDAYIYKPIEKDTLYNVVIKFLDSEKHSL